MPDNRGNTKFFEIDWYVISRVDDHDLRWNHCSVIDSLHLSCDLLAFFRMEVTRNVNQNQQPINSQVYQSRDRANWELTSIIIKYDILLSSKGHTIISWTPHKFFQEKPESSFLHDWNVIWQSSVDNVCHESHLGLLNISFSEKSLNSWAYGLAALSVSEWSLFRLWGRTEICFSVRFLASVHLEVKILNVSFTERITSKNDRSFFTRSRSLLSCKSFSC